MKTYKMIYKVLLTNCEIIEAPTYKIAEEKFTKLMKKTNPFKLPNKIPKNITFEDYMITGSFIEKNCSHCHQPIKDKTISKINLTAELESKLTNEQWTLYDQLKTLQFEEEYEEKNKNKKTKLGKKSQIDTSCYL